MCAAVVPPFPTIPHIAEFNKLYDKTPQINKEKTLEERYNYFKGAPEPFLITKWVIKDRVFTTKHTEAAVAGAMAGKKRALYFIGGKHTGKRVLITKKRIIRG